MGDGKCIMKKAKQNNIPGEYSRLGKQSGMCKKLIAYCECFNFWIANTWWKYYKRKLYTRKALMLLLRIRWISLQLNRDSKKVSRWQIASQVKTLIQIIVTDTRNRYKKTGEAYLKKTAEKSADKETKGEKNTWNAWINQKPKKL